MKNVQVTKTASVTLVQSLADGSAMVVDSAAATDFANTERLLKSGCFPVLRVNFLNFSHWWSVSPIIAPFCRLGDAECVDG